MANCTSLRGFRLASNAVPCFQRVINDIIAAHGCKGTFAYLDDIAVCGRTKEEHDENLKVFLNAAKECNLTLNEGKCKYATETISLLGYHISKGGLQPDPDRVKSVLNMPVPRNSKTTAAAGRVVCVLCAVDSSLF